MQDTMEAFTTVLNIVAPGGQLIIESDGSSRIVKSNGDPDEAIVFDTPSELIVFTLSELPAAEEEE